MQFGAPENVAPDRATLHQLTHYDTMLCYIRRC